MTTGIQAVAMASFSSVVDRDAKTIVIAASGNRQVQGLLAPAIPRATGRQRVSLTTWARPGSGDQGSLMKFVIALVIVIALLALVLQRRGASHSLDASPTDAEGAALEADRQQPHWGASN